MASRWDRFLKEHNVQYLGLLHKITCCNKVPCPKSIIVTTIAERVKMLKASRNIPKNEDKGKKLLPHKLLQLYRKAKPMRIRGTLRTSFPEMMNEYIIKKVQLKPEDFHKCKFCHKQFSFKTNLYRHQKSHKLTTVRLAETDKEEGDNEHVEDEDFVKDQCIC